MGTGSGSWRTGAGLAVTIVLAACQTTGARAVEDSGALEPAEAAAPAAIVAAAEPVVSEEPMHEPMRPMVELDKDGVIYVVGADPKLPFVRYLDGQISPSNSCAVRIGNKLNRKIPPAYVNGRPIGFC